MAQQPLIQAPPDQMGMDSYTVTGTDITFMAPKGAPQTLVDQLGMKAFREAATRNKVDQAEAAGGPMIGAGDPLMDSTPMRVLTGLLPDMASAAATRVPGVGPGIKTLLSLGGAAVGEGARQAVTQQEPSLMDAITSLLFTGGAPRAANRVREGAGNIGDQLQRHVFREGANTTRDFPTVNVQEEIAQRRLEPTTDSADSLVSARRLSQGRRNTAVQGQQAPFAPVLDSLTQRRDKLRQAGGVTGNATGVLDEANDLDNMITYLQGLHPSGSVPAEAMLESKIQEGMRGRPAYQASRPNQGRATGDTSEASRAIARGESVSLKTVPGVAEEDRELEVLKAIEPIVQRAAGKAESELPWWMNPRFLAGTGAGSSIGAMTGMATGDPMTGLLLGTAIGTPIGLAASSPKRQLQLARGLQSGRKVPLEEIVRLILAGGGATVDANEK